jgi:transcriptional regulator with XRE-family HTH domain
MERKAKRIPAKSKPKPPGKGPSGAGDFLTDSSQVERHVARAKAKESVGDRVKNARAMRGLTLEDVSSRTGISVRTLQRVESDQAIPPLGELMKLGKALEMKMGFFISPGVEKPMTVVRSGQRRAIARHGAKKSERYGYFYESLAAEKADRMMEPFMVTLQPTDVEELSTHEGQEFIFVLEGQMKAWVGDQVELLDAGDALYYDSTQPHCVRCVGGTETRILAVLYQPPA